MLLAVAKVGTNVPCNEMTVLHDLLFEKLKKGAKTRHDLQIIEVIVCTSDLVTGIDVEIDLLLNENKADSKCDDQSSFYESIAIGASKNAGFIPANVNVLRINERILAYISQSNQSTTIRSGIVVK